MIRVILKGDIFEACAEAYVSPVNTVGVAGRGMARQYKFYCPWNFDQYKFACENGKIEIGKMFVGERPPGNLSFWWAESDYQFPDKTALAK